MKLRINFFYYHFLVTKSSRPAGQDLSQKFATKLTKKDVISDVGLFYSIINVGVGDINVNIFWEPQLIFNLLLILLFISSYISKDSFSKSAVQVKSLHVIIVLREKPILRLLPFAFLPTYSKSVEIVHLIFGVTQQCLIVSNYHSP